MNCAPGKDGMTKGMFHKRIRELRDLSERDSTMDEFTSGYAALLEDVRAKEGNKGDWLLAMKLLQIRQGLWLCARYLQEKPDERDN